MFARSPEGTRPQILKLKELKDLRRQSILPPSKTAGKTKP
jgi:hypothetical protein